MQNFLKIIQKFENQSNDEGAIIHQVKFENVAVNKVITLKFTISRHFFCLTFSSFST